MALGGVLMGSAMAKDAANAIPMSNAFREDVVKPSFDRDEMLKNAPSALGGGYTVPKVVE